MSQGSGIQHFYSIFYKQIWEISEQTQLRPKDVLAKYKKKYADAILANRLI